MSWTDEEVRLLSVYAKSAMQGIVLSETLLELAPFEDMPRLAALAFDVGEALVLERRKRLQPRPEGSSRAEEVAGG